jgi:hypothetical protein
MNNLPTKFVEVPTKTELEAGVTEWIATTELTPLQKLLVIKELEFVIDDAKKKLRNTAVMDFLETYQGVMSMDIQGVKMQLKDMSKSITLKDPTYQFSDYVVDIEGEILKAEAQVKYLKDKLKLEKTKEINNGAAKKLDEIFEEPKSPEANYQLTITLRK